MSRLVYTPADALEFVKAEILESHALLTKCQVPTLSADNEKLSLSQRVNMLADAFIGTVRATAVITKAKEGPKYVPR